MFSLVIEASLSTLFIQIGKTAELWLEVRSWTGWRVQRESSKLGGTVYWGFLEMSYGRQPRRKTVEQVIAGLKSAPV